MIELITLGDSAIYKNGDQLGALSGLKQKVALLVYLTLEGPVARDRLLFVFWPDREEDRARHALSQALYVVKRELGVECVRGEGDQVDLVPGSVTLDAQQLESAGAAEDWKRVVELYNGAFLQQFHLAGAPEFEDWQTRTRARLARLARRAFAHVIEERVAAGDLEGALNVATRRAGLEPLEDEAQHTLIALLAATGNRAAALEHYEAYSAQLSRELQVEPLEETAELIGRIREGELPEFRPLGGGDGAAQAIAEEERAENGPQPRAVPESTPIVARSTAADLRRLRWPRRFGAAHLIVSLAALVVGVLAGKALLENGILARSRLDPNRIAVFPLVVSGDEAAAYYMGEDVATWIGYALDDTEPLKWLDGWQWLDESQRAEVRLVTAATARSLAREHGARFYIDGRIVTRGDSADVILWLHDAHGDSAVARAGASSLSGDVVRAGLSAVTELLPALVTPSQGVDPTWLSDRVPASVAHFLLGERAFRRARFSEAFSHYRKAVDSDSGFALAALKGAQSASWNWRFREAEALTSTALQGVASLEPRYTSFARGLSEYFAGRADSALSHLSQALQMDPEWLDAWMARGEVLTHLIPAESPLDSLAELAFEEVTRLDPDFAPALFHLIEFALRKGDVRRAEDLMREFRLANTDSLELVRTAELMLTCVRRSRGIGWSEEVKRSPNEVFLAAQSLAVGGAQPDCAEAAWNAVVTEDTASDAWARNRRFNAVLGLQSLAIAQGRDSDARALLEKAELSEDQLAAFYILDATAGAELADHAEEGARRFREYYASGSAPSGPYGLFLWFLGIWEAHQGDQDSLQLISDSLSAIAERHGRRRDILLSKSLRARVALAKGDSTAALALLADLAPTKRRRNPWQPWESLGADHLTLAEILLTRREYARALSVAANFDAPARPAADLVYLPASLSVRLRAARALGDRAAAKHYRSRLAMVGREDLISR